MIASFENDETRKAYLGQPSRRLPPDIQRTARRKLLYIDNARNLRDLRIPPGNRLEALIGDRNGQHSIRINDQWRICFTWKVTNSSGDDQERNADGSGGNAYDVEIADYH